MRWAAAAILLAGLALGTMACGGGDNRRARDKPRLVVSAAASMKEALEKCSPKFAAADVRLSFAGSDELAAQIRRGVKPDVYSAANTELPARLRREGLLEQPVKLVTNRLVVAVPRDSEIGSVEDLARPGSKLALGSESVPIGAYTRKLLSRLPANVARAILANVRSNEPDARGIVGKLTQGAADAGFAYESDVRAARGKLRSVALPGTLQPSVVYAAGVVKDAPHPGAARRYLHDLAAGRCHTTLLAAGFGPTP